MGTRHAISPASNAEPQNGPEQAFYSVVWLAWGPGPAAPEREKASGCRAGSLGLGSVLLGPRSLRTSGAGRELCIFGQVVCSGRRSWLTQAYELGLS